MKTRDWFVTSCLLLVVAGTFLGFVIWRIDSTYRKDTATAHDLKNAIGSYLLEYQKAPGTSGIQQKDDVEFSSDLEFMKCISGGESETALLHNPRGIVFFYNYPGKRSRQTYLRGAELQLVAQDLRDSRGGYFQIRMDANGDGKVANPITNELSEEAILVWSAGKDGKFETWRDNVITWDW